MRAVIIDFENRNVTIRTPFDDSRSECLFGKTFFRKPWSSFVRSQCVHSLIWACIILRLRRSESLFYSFRLYVMILFWVCFFRNDFLPFFYASTDISNSSFFFNKKTIPFIFSSVLFWPKEKMIHFGLHIWIQQTLITHSHHFHQYIKYHLQTFKRRDRSELQKDV